MLYIGRLLGGLAAGISCAVAPCYIGTSLPSVFYCNTKSNRGILGEIATPNVRGTVGFFFSTNIGLGILFTSLLGLGLDWRWISGLCAITPLVLFTILYTVPESPYFLVKNGELFSCCYVIISVIIVSF